MGLMKSMLPAVLYETHLQEQAKLAPRTIRLYVRVVTQFLKHSPDLLDSNSYIEFLIETAKKKKNQANFYALKSFVTFHISDIKVRNSIINSMKNLGVKQQPSTKYMDKKPLSENELNNLLNAFETPKAYVISVLMIETGMRIGDVMKVLKGSIYIESEQDVPVMKVNYLGKGGKQTTKWIWNMGVADIIINYMTKYVSDTDYIFVDRKYWKQNRMDDDMSIAEAQDTNRNYYWQELKMALKLCNIDPDRFACHSFRRDYARKMYNWCKDIDSLRKLMGHSNIETTARYLQQEGYDVKDITKDYFFKGTTNST